MSNARRSNTWHRRGRDRNRQNSASTRGSCTGWASCDWSWTCSRPTGSLQQDQGGRRRRRPYPRWRREPWRERTSKFRCLLRKFFWRCHAYQDTHREAHATSLHQTESAGDLVLAKHPRARDTNLQNLHRAHGTGHRDRRELQRHDSHERHRGLDTVQHKWVQHSPLIISRNICGLPDWCTQTDEYDLQLASSKYNQIRSHPHCCCTRCHAL